MKDSAGPPTDGPTGEEQTVEEPTDLSDLREIDRQRESWIAAINASDAGGFVAVLAEDAVWLPAGRTAISGADGIRDWLAGPFSAYRHEFSVSDLRLRVAGDWAVELARFRTQAIDRSGAEAPTHEGEYTILWRRAPGSGWVIERYADHTGLSGA